MWDSNNELDISMLRLVIFEEQSLFMHLFVTQSITHSITNVFTVVYLREFKNYDLAILQNFFLFPVCV